MTIWGRKYQDLEIKSDYRVHEKVVQIIDSILPKHSKILDIATGNGALAKRISDLFPDISIEINDYEKEAKYEGASKLYHLDLNVNFEKEFSKYDLILAVEIVEHLHNPWHFIANIVPLLKDDGHLIVSTPNTDSFLDRLHYLIEGHSFYFGENGYNNSGGHITEVPDWLIKKIAEKNKLKLVYTSNVDTNPHFGKKKLLLAILIFPIYKLFAKRKNNRSINIFHFVKAT
jgi:SAM-dependent methyltransferase